MEEIWKDIPGYEGLYQVSNYGKVKSVEKLVSRGAGKTKRMMPEHILSLRMDKKGYVVYSLWKHNKGKNHFSHQLVGIAFLENPEGKKTINHKNAVKTDNFVGNLEWATQQENNSHAFNNGLSTPFNGGYFGEGHGRSKLKEADVLEIRRLHKEEGLFIRDIAKMFGMGQSPIQRIIKREAWAHI